MLWRFHFVSRVERVTMNCARMGFTQRMGFFILGGFSLVWFGFAFGKGMQLTLSSSNTPFQLGTVCVRGRLGEGYKTHLHSSGHLNVSHCRLVFPGILNPDFYLKRN